ncbi:ORF3a protein [Severe acute respiratory syndrome-related coronavirus]|uniref:ORF3a protein n=1 Tax=Severe acute respiratory syndrome coronavirus TaxID=694009 RepID=A0A3Q8ARD5_SARS|nr:ORF3a protein [Severe acute respiratory syndrome-related coronavirus]
MDLFISIFTLGSITRGSVQNAVPANSLHATATIPLQATLPFGWLIVGVALLAVFQNASKVIPFNSLWQRCLYQSFQLVCSLLVGFLTVYVHLLLAAAGLEAPFLYLLALIYFLQCVVFGRFLLRCWLCWKCKSKNPLIYDASYFVCWHTHTHDYCIPYNSITETIVLTAGDGVTIPIKTQDYQIGGFVEKWESGVKDYVTLIGLFTEIHYQLESTQISADTGINNATFFLFSKYDRESESVQVHTIDGSSGVVNPIYDEPTPTTSVPL